MIDNFIAVLHIVNLVQIYLKVWINNYIADKKQRALFLIKSLD